MYQCIIPPRIFLAIGVGLLIFSLVLGWISFSVPNWLQFYERNGFKDLTNQNSSSDDNLTDLKRFGLWYKCVFSTNLNDFVCTLWNNDAPSFVRVAQVLIPFGLSLGCLSFLSAIIGFMSSRAFITTVLFSALFAFLSFIFTTIGVTVFATEGLVYVERLRLNNNNNPRCWGMWLVIPSLVLACFASICFIFASIFHWCDYRRMQVTGILTHSVDKYGGSVCKAPSDSSNTTSGMKKQNPYMHQQQAPGQDYPNACYQIGGPANNNQNSINYPPPPPSYPSQMHHQGNVGTHNPAFQNTPGFFGYSRPPSPMSNPMYPHPNLDPYHHRNYMTENSELDEMSRMSRSRRRSRSRPRRHSSHRSRSHSPRESSLGGNNSQENNLKQPQFIPIPVPYYQPPIPHQTSSSQSITQPLNTSSNNNNSNSQPVSYVIQPPKQQFIEEIIQPTTKATNMLTYGNGQSVLVSNPTQPIYTIAYRANNGGNMLASNILTGPPATTYVTAGRNQFTEITSQNSDSDREDKNYRLVSKRSKLKRINANEAWTWRKL